MIISPEVLLILGGDKYLTAKYVIPPVVMGCVCQFVYTLLVNIEQYSKKTIGMAFASVTAAGLNYILNLLLIPRFGYIAAAYTTLAGYMWLLIVHMFFVYKLNLNFVYSYKFIFLIITVMIALSLLIDLLYDQSIIRGFVFVVYIFALLYIAYRNRNAVANIVRELKK